MSKNTEDGAVPGVVGLTWDNKAEIRGSYRKCLRCSRLIHWMGWPMHRSVCWKGADE